MFSDLLLFTLQFARAGGGGSSSSGGGGGELLALIGYFPSYYLGRLIKKLLPRKPELIVSGGFATLFSILILGFGVFAGSLGVYVAACIIVGIWAGWGAAFFGVWDRLRERSKKAKQDISIAAQTDSAWNEQTLTAHAKQVFLTFQQDWSNFNTANFATYMTEPLARHNYLLMRTLHELHRTNSMNDVAILEAMIFEAKDSGDDSQDSYLVAFKARARDQLIDNTTGETLFTDSREFTEYWRFLRSGSTWLLSDIAQETANPSTLQRSIKTFANNNAMSYSLDMGWLFLPRRGVLFGKGKFGSSDINNHVVGLHNDHLVQLYTYQPDPRNSSDAKVYTVAQINLPKTYGGIIIQRDVPLLKRSFTRSIPRDYTKFEFEWPDFNKRYDVFATDADRLAAFELLNPGFMAYLYDADAGLSIEVTDNIVYLYKDVTTVTSADYEKMMTILGKAFKELQL